MAEEDGTNIGRILQQSPKQQQQQQYRATKGNADGDKRSCFEENEKTEIYEAEQSSSLIEKPWWTSSFLVPQPILFGTWEGVFTSCLINMFGVVVFLRTGWMVGNAGIGYSLLIIAITELLALVAILSSIGVAERCRIDRGGVYSLLSYVLGNRIGAAVTLIYCFGQAIGCSLCVVAFGESIMDLLNMHDDVWITRAIAAGLLVILVGINIAGVVWVVGLQLIFVILLFVAALDFVVGSFVKTDPANGIVGYRWQTFLDNGVPSYEAGETFFTVLGVFFPSVCGVFAGFNMSGDLKDPRTNISVGTLSALGVCVLIYVAFVFVLGSTCLRSRLQTDFMIADKISATHVFWIIGLYELSASSAAGNISGPPNILQAIAADHANTLLEPIAAGRGPNKIPVFATLLFAIISLVFIFVGQLNTLGPILTMPFLLTYAAVDYAYFVLKTTVEMKKKTSDKTYDDETTQEETTILQNSHKGYGTIDRNNGSDGSILTDADLNQLFSPERLPEDSPGQRETHAHLAIKTTEDEEEAEKAPVNEFTANAEAPNDTDRKHDYKQPRRLDEDAKSLSPVSRFCNRWVALLAAVISIVAMFCIQWIYALANLVAAFVLWLLLGMSNACLFPGIGEFSLTGWICSGFRKAFFRVRGNKKQMKQSISENRVIVRENGDMFPTRTGLITDKNEDFADREPYHQTEIIKLNSIPVYNNEAFIDN